MRHVSEVIKSLVAAAGNPHVIKTLAEIERMAVQAEAAGVRDQFEAAWAYEMARFRAFPGVALTPKQTLQLVLETAQ